MRHILLVLTTLLASCISPWAVMPGGLPNFAHAVLPPGTEQVEIPVDGEMLRGIYVPGEPGAPLVLHLLEAMGSATLGCLPEVLDCDSCGHPVLWQLQGLGYASLMVDYRGVGASSGSRHVEYLIPDSVAMWDEAVRRVGGDEKRIVLRTTSLGTIGGSHLVLAGHRPRCWIANAPIDPRTVADNVLYAALWSPIAFLATVVATDVADVDPYAALASKEVPKLCFLNSDDDPFVRAAELASFRSAVASGSGCWVTLNESHIRCAGACHWLRPEERYLLRDVVGRFAPVDARLFRFVAAADAASIDARCLARLRLLAEVADCDPTLAVAAAQSALPATTLAQWVPGIERVRVAAGFEKSRDEWAALFAAVDFDHPLRSDVVAALSSWLLGLEVQLGPLPIDPLVEQFVEGLWPEASAATYGGEKAPGVSVEQVLAAISEADGPGIDPLRRCDRVQRHLHAAVLRGPSKPNSVRSWLVDRGPKPERLRSAYEKDFRASEEPHSLLGIDPELLLDVFVAELPTDAPQLLAFVHAHVQELRQLLIEAPHYCDFACFAALWWQAEGAIYECGLSPMWSRRNCDRLLTMPWQVQAVLQEQMRAVGRLDRATSRRLAIWLKDAVELGRLGAPLQRQDAVRLSDRAIPWRFAGEPERLEAWVGGTWEPAEHSRAY